MSVSILQDIAREQATMMHSQLSTSAAMLRQADPVTMTPLEIRVMFNQVATMFETLAEGCQQSIGIIDGMEPKQNLPN